MSRLGFPSAQSSPPRGEEEEGPPRKPVIGETRGAVQDKPDETVGGKDDPHHAERDPCIGHVGGQDRIERRIPDKGKARPNGNGQEDPEGGDGAFGSHQTSVVRGSAI